MPRKKRSSALKLFLTLIIVLGTMYLNEVSKPAPDHVRVIGITDGDTVTVITSDQEKIKVRLAQIDAPEHDQPFGDKSKKILSDLVYGDEVVLEKEDIDKYGRTVGTIFKGNQNINLEMVAEGGAWAYEQYLWDRSFVYAQKNAQDHQLGLWALQKDQIIAPWDWRHKQSH